MDEIVLSYSHVNIYQGADLVLSDVNIEMKQGEFIYLIGKTGAGKSSLIKTIYGEVPIKEGDASICGYNLKKLKKSDLPQLRRKLGIVFQDFKLLNDLTVYGNLEFVLKATGWANKKKRQERMEEVLSEVALPGIGSKMPYQLSGGEQQRLVIARAMLNNPPLFLADEPTGNLDGKTGTQVLELLLELNKREGATLVMVTHDPALAAHADRIITLRDGLVVSDALTN